VASLHDGDVRRATEDDVPALSRVLGAAFATDPPLAFLAGGRGAPERLARYFAALLPRLYLPRGEVWTTDDLGGAAVWVRPGAWPVSLREQAPVLGTLARTFARHPARALAATEAIESGHPTTPHWYLDYIGVDPGLQGRGRGSALLAPVLERCDRERLPAYLNAGSPRSRDLYARHGFRVTEEFRLPLGGPPLWRMWRAPGGGSTAPA
jgi:GNAT superfamily N-acetyltransferase